MPALMGTRLQTAASFRRGDIHVDGVISNPFSGQTYIRYGTYTFENISSQVQVTPHAADHAVKYVVDMSAERQVSSCKKYYSDAALARSPVAGVKREVDAETAAVINGFFDGAVSEEELSGAFQDLAEKLSSACEDAGYPFPLRSIGAAQAMTETFYSEFRRGILETAVQRGIQEGKRYLTGEMNAQRNWKYYNSDYYFKSEAAISAITDGLNKLAQGPAYKGFTLPDYRAEGLNLYYNYNTAFSNGFAVDEQFMLDPDAIPPRDFQWFYQSGGDGTSKIIEADSLTIEHPDGTTEFIDYRPKSFDPTDYRTATTWASYRDAQGNKHVVSTDFLYNFSKDDLRNAADLLSFTRGDPARDSAANRFLNNLQVYSQGYFSRFPQIKRFHCRA